MQSSFRIPDCNLLAFISAFEKLSRKAVKLNLNAPTYTITGTKTVISETGNYVRLFHLVNVSTEEIKIDGWQLQAVINHTPEGNIIRCLPNCNIPDTYRTTYSYCEHCGIDRRRNDTFVLKREQEYKQVGRTCLVDFLGHTATDIAGKAELLFELHSLDEGFQSFGGEGVGWVTALDTYLAFVAETIVHHGWMSKQKANDEGFDPSSATCNLAMNYLERNVKLRKFDKPSEESTQLAKNAIAWASSLTQAETQGNDYLHNISVIARSGAVKPNQLGFGASIIPSYKRYLESLVPKVERKPSEYQGKLKERSNWELKVDKTIPLAGAYGTTFLHLMSDQAGNAFKWMASSECLDEGKAYIITGTVKDHKEYKGVKQTSLTRCKCALVRA